MTPDTEITFLKNHDVFAAAKIVAWGLLLSLCCYSIVQMPEPWLSVSRAENTSGITDTTASLVHTNETAAAVPTQKGRRLTREQGDDSSDGPRECSLEKGITTACVYD